MELARVRRETATAAATAAAEAEEALDCADAT
jgi:hypothetical protein